MKMTKVTSASRTASFGAGAGGTEYIVKAHDTLEGIAARYDCTPTQLQKMNKLASRLLFPGQKIYVPDPRSQQNPPPLSRKDGSQTSADQQESSSSTTTAESVFSAMPAFHHGSTSASSSSLDPLAAASNGATKDSTAAEGKRIIIDSFPFFRRFSSLLYF